MTTPKRIGVYYSRGPHYLRAIKHLRKQYPAAHVTAVVPPGYPRYPIVELADKVAVTEKSAYAARDLRGLLGLVRQVRGLNLDAFVVLFDTPKLRALASVSGAPKRYCFGVDGRFLPLRMGVIPMLLRAVYRGIRGRITYARIYCIVRFLPVRRGHD